MTHGASDAQPPFWSAHAARRALAARRQSRGAAQARTGSNNITHELARAGLESSDGCLVDSAGARLPTAATAVWGGMGTELHHHEMSGRWLLRRRDGWLAAHSPSPMTSCPKFTVASMPPRESNYTRPNRRCARPTGRQRRRSPPRRRGSGIIHLVTIH